MSGDLVFESGFLKQLETLYILSRRLKRGSGRGEHLSSRKGYSLELSDYRNYTVYDDFRHIDWNVSSRLEKLFVKVFRAQEEMTIYLLLDASSSMATGNPSKLHYAKHVAASLAYIGLSSLERVYCGTFAEKLKTLIPLGRNRQSFHKLLRHLSGIKPSGRTDLNKSLSEYARTAKKPGIVILISDMLDENGFSGGLLSLLYARLEVFVIQVLDKSDMHPFATGPLKLTDRETGKTITLHVDDSIIDLYTQHALKHTNGLKDFCMRKEIDFIQTDTELPFTDLVLKYLREGSRIR
ncbi:MAG: DUF58 domain-containing protein [Spirochaetales bacterium]|nr:DUF58 domain-containing protein [Spirochaetales bacterium]